MEEREEEQEEEGAIWAYSPDDAILRLSPEAATLLLERMTVVDARIAAMSADEYAAYRAERREQGARALAQIQTSRPKKIR